MRPRSLHPIPGVTTLPPTLLQAAALSASSGSSAAADDRTNEIEKHLEALQTELAAERDRGNAEAAECARAWACHQMAVAQAQDSERRASDLAERLRQCEEQLQAAREESLPCLSGEASPRLRLRYLYSSPAALPPLEIEAEISAVEKSVQGIMQVEVEVASAPTLKEATLEENSWLHISMHSVTGKNGRGLVLEDSRTARGHPLWKHELEQLVKAGGGASTKFMFLGVCESEEFADVFRAAGVQNIVYCKSQVQDRHLPDFSRQLYHSLAQGRSLPSSFEIAAETAKHNGDATEYGLYTTSDETLVLQPSGMNLWQNFSSRHQRPQLPRKAEDFVGRWRVIGHVLRCLHSCRIVMLHCAAPHGRTATLREIAHYVTAPGRKFAGRDRCAFFPHSCPGGLLIVDDADSLLDVEREQVRRHLETEGAQVLAGCQDPQIRPFESDEKAVCVPLDPLEADEAAHLFLRRCHRPLKLGDLLPPEAICDDPDRVVDLEEAVRLLRRPIEAFAGDPGKVRRAAEQVRPGSAALHGNLSALVSPAITPPTVPHLCQGPPGRSLVRCRRSAIDTGQEENTVSKPSCPP